MARLRRQHSNFTNETLKGAVALIAGQTFSRLLTFLGNVALVRIQADSQPLGIASTELHLMVSLTTGLAREGVRRACLREIPPPDSLSTVEERIADVAKWRDAANMTKLSFFLGTFLIAPLLMSRFWNSYAGGASSLSPEEIEEYHQCLVITALAASVELAAESMFVVSQTALLYSLRSKTETLAATSRMLTSLFFAYFLKARLTAFALGYLAGSCAMFIGYFLGLAVEAGDFRAPLRIVAITSFPADLLREMFDAALVAPAEGENPPSPLARRKRLFNVAFLSSVQAVWKMMLSEGEKFVMIYLNVVASDRGDFAIASNLGGLAARLILQPCEEAAFSIFGKLKHVERLRKEMDRVLGILSRMAACFGLLFSCVATQYTHLLIFVLYGAKYADGTEAPYLLSWYCAYVAVMACNGTTEAFVQAVTNEGESAKFNLWLFVCSCGFLALALVLVPAMGTSGLVLGNCLVMSGRILFNIWYAKSRRNSKAKFFPDFLVLCAFFLALIATHASNLYLYRASRLGEQKGKVLPVDSILISFVIRAIPHVVVGAVATAGLALVVGKRDVEMVDFIKQGGRIGDLEGSSYVSSSSSSVTEGGDDAVSNGKPPSSEQQIVVENVTTPNKKTD